MELMITLCPSPVSMTTVAPWSYSRCPPCLGASSVNLPSNTPFKTPLTWMGSPCGLIFLSSLNKIVQELVLILVIVLNRLMIEMVFMW